MMFRPIELSPHPTRPTRFSKTVAAVCACLLLALLILLPMIGRLNQSLGVQVFSAFYRSGALVFGGGHVVLPLLQNAVVARGWVTQQSFLAGYGAAQAFPAPSLPSWRSLVPRSGTPQVARFSRYSDWLGSSDPDYWLWLLFYRSGANRR